MPILHITRGLPASGKTTFARAWVSDDHKHRARVNRDTIRAMLDDGEFIKGVTEQRVLAVRDATIAALLRQDIDVICDDTNLPQRTARDLAKLAHRGGAELRITDLTCIPLETCLERNAARTGKERVPDGVIRDLHARYLAGRSHPLPWPGEPSGPPSGLAVYEPKPGTPQAVLVDIDGTVALMNGRSPFDETRVHEDHPNLPVIEAVRAAHGSGKRIIFLSGRTETCRDATITWLREHIKRDFDGPYMRPAGDPRKDAIVKQELFDEYVRDYYDVAYVIDDRRQVVQMWRALGLTVLQCAPGDF